MSFQDWSPDPGENTSVGSVNIGEGMSPSGVNNAIRTVMAEVVAFDKPFPTVADLRNNEKTGVARARILGFVTENDGGEGSFYADTSDSSSSDDGVAVIVDAAGTRWKRLNRVNVSLAAAGVQPSADTNLSADLIAAVAAGRILTVPAGDYYVSAPWVVSDDNVRIMGEPGAMMTTDDYAVSELQINAITSSSRLNNVTVQFMGFKDHPPVPGGGSDNNNHPLHFAGVSNGRALFNDFSNTGLGIRFGRSADGTTGGRGCHDGLALGNYFIEPNHMVHEFMDSNSSGNKAIATGARSIEGSSGGHFYRFNGQANIGALGTIFRTADGGSGTVTAFQGGTGHLSLGNIGWFPDQGINATNTGNADKWCIGAHHIIKNANDFGIWADDCEGLQFSGIFYWDSEATDEPHKACHILGDSKYVSVAGLFDGSNAETGASHCLIEGERHRLDITLRRSVGGLNGINVAANYCQGRLDSEGASDADASYQDIRVSGTGNVLHLTGVRMAISGSSHILDIVATGGNVVISASSCAVRIHGTGNLTINGNNNSISGTVTGTVADNGTGNNWSGFVGMCTHGYTNNLTSDASGDVTINPGLKVTPRYAMATVLSGSLPYVAVCTTRNASATKFRIYSAVDGAPVVNTAGIALSWAIGL